MPESGYWNHNAAYHGRLVEVTSPNRCEPGSKAAKDVSATLHHMDLRAPLT